MAKENYFLVDFQVSNHRLPGMRVTMKIILNNLQVLNKSATQSQPETVNITTEPRREKTGLRGFRPGTT